MSAVDAVERRRIVVRGIVQGVGFRPFVATTAERLGLSGFCGNDERSVFVEAEGAADALDELIRTVTASPPPLAHVLDVRVETVETVGQRGFTIVPSRTVGGARTLIPPDVATCVDCLGEMADPQDRRYRHPFITCTNCGPRFTIITDLPYDRPQTTMAAFAMCDACRREYEDPADRRFHAQPVSCHACGPRLWLETDGERVEGVDKVLAAVQRMLAEGLTIAIKGIGGYHVACDATNEDAVSRLRRLKRRPDKPFAVMAPNIAAVRELAYVSDVEEALLSSPARPITLVQTAAGAPVAPSVAPGLDQLGVLLPYTPVHHLLFSPVPGSAPERPRLLVMTSGNLSDEPICYLDEDARTRLGAIADAFLMHDRPIADACEDSVVMVAGRRTLPIRRSRGYAPLPVVLDSPGPVTLAVGAEVKNTYCLVRDDFAFCSPHLGDMGTVESQLALTSSVDRVIGLHRTRPDVLVCDAHPGYATTRWAADQADRRGARLVEVQHHHAHAAALLAEHGRIGTEAIIATFDGTGYGCDRTVWGGEILAVGADISTCERVGHIESFPLAGGETAVRNPFRVALAVLRQAGVLTLDGLPLEDSIRSDERAAVMSQLEAGVGCTVTTSAGRLFDAVASILGVRHRVSYEAQAAVELEARARAAVTAARLHMVVDADTLRIGELIRGLVAGLREGESVNRLALGFHHAVADATVQVVTALCASRGVATVGLSGGVFQNRILADRVSRGLLAHGLEVLSHQVVPPNDGGLSLGQAVVGRAVVQRS